MEKITTYYIEMKSPSELKEINNSLGLLIMECEFKQIEFSKFLNQLVGDNYQWFNWRYWSDEKWKEYIENDNLRTWVAYYKGSPAGYYEIERQENGDTEIIFLGLIPKFIGKGFGGYLISRALKSAWEWEGAKRVWCHTCSNDHPKALNSYLARGLKIYKEEISENVQHKPKLNLHYKTAKFISKLLHYVAKKIDRVVAPK